MAPVCYSCIQSTISWVSASVGGHFWECRTGHFLSSHLYIVYTLSLRKYLQNTKYIISQNFLWDSNFRYTVFSLYGLGKSDINVEKLADFVFMIQTEILLETVLMVTHIK